MAVVNKRIIDLPERTTLVDDDYVAVDSSNSGTAKYKITDVGSIPNLEERITDAEGDIAGLKEDLSQKAPAIYNTSDEAEVMTFADGANNMPMKSVVLKLVPHQEGTGDPSPENVRPISGYTSVNVTRAGKNICRNLLSTQTVNGVTFTVNADRTITANGTATARIDLYVDTGIKLRANTAYIISGSTGGALNKWAIWVATHGSIQSQMSLDGEGTFTQSSDAVQRVNLTIFNGATVNNQVFKPMLRLASITDATYEPYTATTYPITIPSSAGTVYGGELDVTNGVLRVTHGQIASYSGQSINTPWISSKDVYASGGTPTTGAQVVYPLTTPTEITLDKTTMTTLLGSNTIWMDAYGTIQCEYPADTKMYIDALTAPDDDMVADSNIASGKYFTVNNRLYISTSAIAQGEQIVVGTNCTQTDLATALNALNA